MTTLKELTKSIANSANPKDLQHTHHIQTLAGQLHILHRVLPNIIHEIQAESNSFTGTRILGSHELDYDTKQIKTICNILIIKSRGSHGWKLVSKGINKATIQRALSSLIEE